MPERRVQGIKTDREVLTRRLHPLVHSCHLLSPLYVLSTRLINTSYQSSTSQTMVVKRDAPSSPTPSEYASPPSPALRMIIHPPANASRALKHLLPKRSLPKIP
jgi:hypothetical protein